jgi:autotransporter-associated beta strand protein
MNKRIVSLLLSTGFCFATQAASDSWKANLAGSWNIATNWTLGSVPGITNGTTSTDVATFSTLLTANRAITVDNNRNVGGITFQNPANAAGAATNSAYTLTGGSLLLSSGGVIQVNAGSGTNTSTINSPITIQGNNGSLTLLNNVAGEVAGLVVGAISGASTAGNTTTLYLDGVSEAFGSLPANRPSMVSGALSDGGSGGKLAVVKNGAGLWTMTNSASTFTGGLTINAGTIRYAGNGAQFGVGGVITIGTNATLYHSLSSAITNAQPVVVNGDFTLANWGNVTFSGAINLGSAVRTITVERTNNIFSGVISNGGLIKAGAGELILSGANTYAGGTTVSQGELAGKADGAFGTNNVTVAGGATLTLTGGVLNNCIGDKAKLALATNAVLNLNFVGIEKVGSLSLNGGSTLVPNGVYTAAQLSALGSGTYTGTGSIMVGRVLRLIGITSKP